MQYIRTITPGDHKLKGKSPENVLIPIWHHLFDVCLWNFPVRGSILS
jgi:hypothetical protein